LKVDHPALLAEGEGRHPDRDETVLAEAEVRVRNNLKEEFPVATLVHKLVFGKGSQRRATQHKWPGIKGNFLRMPLTVLANALD
jgi:hypothetical protein